MTRLFLLVSIFVVSCCALAAASPPDWSPKSVTSNFVNWKGRLQHAHPIYLRLKKEDFLGVWIGSDIEGGKFTRLDIRPDLSGYCARMNPADIVGLQYKTQIFRISDVAIVRDASGPESKFEMSFTEVDSKATSSYWRGQIKGNSIQLARKDDNGNWQQTAILHREKEIEATNQVTKARIKELELK